MLNIEAILPGRIYSAIHNSEVELKKGGRSGVPANPLNGHKVTRRLSLKFQAAGRETYARAMRAKHGSDWTPSEQSGWWYTDEKNDCIAIHKGNGRRYVKALPKGAMKTVYYVDGRPATPEEVEVIQEYKKRKESPEDFILLAVDKLVCQEEKS